MYLVALLMIPHMIRKNRAAIYLCWFLLVQLFLFVFLAVFMSAICTQSALLVPSFFFALVGSFLGSVGLGIGGVGPSRCRLAFIPPWCCCPSPPIVPPPSLALYQSVKPSNAHLSLPFVEKEKSPRLLEK